MPSRAAATSLLDAALAAAVRSFATRIGTRGLGRKAATVIADAVLAPGKRLRPTLFLSTRLALQPHRPHGPGDLAMAVALEVLHSFMLVHDDLVDDADTRRGQPTLHRRLEYALRLPARDAANVALVAGDLLFGFALELAAEGAETCGRSRPEVLRLFLDTVATTGTGQALEVLVARGARPGTPAAVRRVYQLKTSHYTFETPLALAALVAGRPALRSAFGPLADALGFAFQLTNDRHEIARLLADPDHPPPDFARGPRTWALALLASRLPLAERRTLDDWLADSSLPPPPIARWLTTHGIPEALDREVARHLARARRAIAGLALPADAKSALTALADSLPTRLAHSESPPAA